MYKIYVPVYNKRLSKKDQESLLLELKKCRIDFVLLVLGRILCSEEQLREEIEIFNQNKRFLNENEINVGAWLTPTIGYGSSFFGDNDAETKFTHLHRLFSDTDVPGAYCPLDENFKHEFLKVIKKVSETGVYFA